MHARTHALEEGREEAGRPVVEGRLGPRPHPHSPPSQGRRSKARIVLLQTLAPPVHACQWMDGVSSGASRLRESRPRNAPDGSTQPPLLQQCVLVRSQGQR